MMSFKAKAESLGRTETEIKSEMAAALGRIGGTLASLIADLRRLREEMQGISEQSRDEIREQYRSIHARARLYYWYLMVQRESIGIRNHDALRELYPIPPIELPI